MNPETLSISTSPHIFKGQTVHGIMYNVILALLPIAIFSVYVFGVKALWLLLVCSITSLATEHVCQKLRGRETTIKDGSALITGILLALILPPAIPLWAAALGAIVSISIGKMVFGGLGYNKFNPALVGRSFLQASFPVMMTSWSNPVYNFLIPNIDITTGATPLSALKFQNQLYDYGSLFLGNTGGSLGETSAVLILLCGMYLVFKRLADWRIIAGVFTGTILFSSVLWQIDPSLNADPLFHILSGGFMLGTFFMATDMVASPTTVVGRWVYGIGIGLMIILIRSFSGLPEGVMYALLLMNAVSPLIERYTQPRVYGHVNKGTINA